MELRPRTEKPLDSVSARYVPPGAYGVSDLEPYGSWREVPTYGSVWVPTAVPIGWAPYTTGSWMLDPYYGWTWVDTAPWGWAPYHYGRWVFLNGFWAWTPGPVVVQAVYAPALVAFFAGPGVRVGISIGGPLAGWVALGWGEPVVPWWGRPGFIHEPSWRGWGGPRVVNNTVINTTTVVNVQNITVYSNASVQNAVVVVNQNRFGQGSISSAREPRVDARSLQLTHSVPQVTATPASFVPTASRGVRPPEEHLKGSVVATRLAARVPVTAGDGNRSAGPGGVPTPAPRIVSAPPQREAAQGTPRAPAGQIGVERPRLERELPPPPPGAPAGAPSARPTSRQPRREPQVVSPGPATPPSQPSDRPAVPQPQIRRSESPQGVAPAVPRPPVGTPTAPAPVTRRPKQPHGVPPARAETQRLAPDDNAAASRARALEPPDSQARPLPGEPANRLSPGRGEGPGPRHLQR